MLERDLNNWLDDIFVALGQQSGADVINSFFSSVPSYATLK